ncbi:MAG: alpha/beta hydrolase [Actinomycetia bacterium]|nr:alpha/beta hydrolase [Actinomycetes bacterium]
MSLAPRPARTRLLALGAVAALAFSACTNGSSGSISAPAPDSGDEVVDPPEESEEAQADNGDNEADDGAGNGDLIGGRFAWRDAGCEFAAADPDLRCGFVTVPVHWDDPDAPDTIDLHVAVLESRASDPAPDPVVYLEGGPGGDALEGLAFSTHLFEPFRQRGDVVVWDQRGTSFSEPDMSCPEVDAADDVLLASTDEPAVELAQAVTALRECGQRLSDGGVDLGQFSSLTSARDAEAIRRALGVEPWNLLGISYGTRLAQTMMREFPGSIRSVILDSVLPTEDTLIDGTAASGEQAAEHLFDQCAADADCATAYPDLADRFEAVVAALDAEPVEMEVVDPLSLEATTVAATGADLGASLFQVLYSPLFFTAFPEVVRRLDSGDTSGLAVLAGQALAQADFFTPAVHYAVTCNDEVGFLDPSTQVGDQGDGFVGDLLSPEGAGNERVYLETCDLFGPAPAAPVEDEPVVSDLPTLVLTGSYDPITPPATGRRVAETLSSVTVVEMPHQGHGSVADECAASIAVAFLDDPASAPDLGCVSASDPPLWLGADLGAVQLEPFVLDSPFVTGSGLVPAGWVEQGDGTWISPGHVLSQLVLVQQGVAGANEGLLLGLLAGQFGLDGPPEPDGTVVAGPTEWNHYEIEVAGSSIELFVADFDAGVGLVVMEGPADLRDQARSSFLPELLGAFSP